MAAAIALRTDLAMRAARSATSAALSVSMSSGSDSGAMLTKESEHIHP